MSKSRNIIIGLAVISGIAIIIGAYLYFQNKKKDDEIKEKEDEIDKKDKKINEKDIEIETLKEDNLKLILDSLRTNPDFSVEIKRQIENLIFEFQEIDEKVSNELAQALQLFQIGQVENAIEDLVKIIEHLLNVHYKDCQNFKNWAKENKKKPDDLHNLLTFCKVEKKIDAIEYQFFIAIKTIRNKEDHEIDLNLEGYLNISGILTAIGGIFKISSIVYPKK